MKTVYNSLIITSWFLLFAPHLLYSNNIIVGTGFYINENGDVLTNKHVIESCIEDSIYFIDFNKNKHRSEIIAISHDYDIAAISTGSKATYIGALAVHPEIKAPVMMDTNWDVLSFGYSMSGDEQFFANGTALANNIYNDPPFIGFAELNITFGASGSALLDRSALVLGIVFGKKGDDYFNPDIKWGMPINTIVYHNLNAILDFANKNNIYIRYDYRVSYHPISFVLLHAERITGKIICNQKI